MLVAISYYREYPGSRAAGARQRTPDEREFQDLTDLYSYQHKTMSRYFFKKLKKKSPTYSRH